MSILEYTTHIAIVIVLFIVSVLLLIFLPHHRGYYSISDVGEVPFLALKSRVKELVSEINEKDFINNTIIIYNANFMNRKYPKIYNALRTLPFVRNAFIYKINPKSDTLLTSYTKSDGDAILRCIIPLVQPSQHKLQIWVNGRTKMLNDAPNANIIVFNPTYMHYYSNTHRRRPGYLLIVDVDRPIHLA